MNYPIWELYELTSGTLVAIISVFHAFIAHLAVGGGLFLWLTDLKSTKENNLELTQYVRKHTKFFLLLTMVAGGVTGVGIWFIIALANPAATSSLIHNFVFGWAIEWVFFIGEIVALLIYHYRFDVMKQKQRLNVAFLYFLFAWLSMVVINGILAYMLTPGKWLETGEFWDGFFNPTYFPSLLFRSAAAAMIAGMFGYVTVVFSLKSKFRSKMLKYCTKWLLYPVPFIIIGGIWYLYSIPETLRITNFTMNSQASSVILIFIVSSILIFVFGLFINLKIKPVYQKILIFVILIIGQAWYGGFEYLREYARKPFIITDHMYSTSILLKDADLLNKEGVLKHAKWTPIKEVTNDNIREAGRELFNIQCLCCHTIDGVKNDILKKTKNLTYMGMLSHLEGQGRILKYMPPVFGTVKEKEALAEFIIGDLHKRKIERVPEKFTHLKKLNHEVPAFDKKNDDYVLFVWNDLGMSCTFDSDPWWVILPPKNTFEATLIKRGETPEIITEGVELTYKVEKGFEEPVNRDPQFWEYSKSNYGKELEKNIGLTGNGMSGKFTYNEDKVVFIASAIPITPYPDDMPYNPYALFDIEAKDMETGKLLMKTKVVAPNSTEAGCKNCHAGGWRYEGVSGISDQTAINVLHAHDRISGTNLYEEAKDGKPQNCKACHLHPDLENKDPNQTLDLAAAMHGWHSNYMPFENENACRLCHPDSPDGSTKCSRSIHDVLGMTCVDCHGHINDHAISVLKGQSYKTASKKYLDIIKPVRFSSQDEIDPRIPWENEPECLSCHEDYEKPEKGFTSFNKWSPNKPEIFRYRTDDAGIRCVLCHNAPHAEFPARNIWGVNRDNIQPVQYQGNPLPIGSEQSCYVCHKKSMEDPIHHENMMRKFRNAELVKKEGLM
ncbi:MAG: hypothetical protein JEY94_05060 [Melioribacteraceae bacterium]|nr:hypothetical protein [Melioribacteraceae bacterium]